FSKDPAKQKRLKELEEGPEYNFKRSQGNLKALTKAGLSGSLEDSFKIFVKLMEDAAAAGVTMTPGTKIDLRTELPGPSAKLIIESKWKVQERLDSGEIILRLDTLIYAA